MSKDVTYKLRGLAECAAYVERRASGGRQRSVGSHLVAEAVSSCELREVILHCLVSNRESTIGK